MKVAVLQKIDRWIGVPLCFSLTIIRKLFGRKTLSGRQQANNIVFIKLAEQGSTVLAYPAIRRAVELVGKTNVYFVVFEENRFILDALNVVPKENVFTISNDGFIQMTSSAMQVISRLRKMKPDAAIDLEFFARGSAALTFFSGAKNRSGFHSFFGAGPYRGDLMTHRLLYNPYLHTSQIFQTMVEALRADPEKLPMLSFQPPAIEPELPRFSAEQDEVGAVKKLVLQVLGRPELPRLILLNPNASDLLPIRKWETSRYVELARRIIEHFPEVHVGLTGAPGEAAPIEEVARAVCSDRCVSLAGKTSLRQLLILYSMAEILVTNDSGPAHFAALTPIHVVTLFGPETPKLFAARTPRNVALWAGVACSPCVNAYNNRQTLCRNNVCMQQITVDQVFDEVCRVYDQRHPAKPA
jgi:ADP-heptose:LPS heptosyltransferase